MVDGEEHVPTLLSPFPLLLTSSSPFSSYSCYGCCCCGPRRTFQSFNRPLPSDVSNRMKKAWSMSPWVLEKWREARKSRCCCRCCCCCCHHCRCCRCRCRCCFSFLTIFNIQLSLYSSCVLVFSVLTLLYSCGILRFIISVASFLSFFLSMYMYISFISVTCPSPSLTI